MGRWNIASAVRSGDPRATWLIQNMPLLFIVPLSLWLAASEGRLALAAAAWFGGGSLFNLLWAPYLRTHRHPPAGQSQSIASATSMFGSLVVPETWLLLVSFMFMGLILGLASGGRRHPMFQAMCITIATAGAVVAEPDVAATWLIFIVLVIPFTFSAVSFASAELNHRERRVNQALRTNGLTAWDTDPDGRVTATLGVGIAGIAAGVRISDLVHPEDERPDCPEVGATLEYRLDDGSGRWRWIREHVDAGTTVSDTLRSSVADITDEKRAIADDRRRATQDQLTGIPNRSSHIRQADDFAKNGVGFVLLVDLDGFKEINDTLGHTVGDAVLQIFARRLTSSAQDRPTGAVHVGRIGGDEFACLIEDDQAQALALGDELVGWGRESFAVEAMTVSAGVSVGIAPFVPGVRADEIRRRAGVALKSAKSAGGGDRVLYDAALEHHSARRQALVAHLPVALGNGEIRMHHQPQVDLETGEIVGFEALVRWHHPELGVLVPADFLDLVLVGGHSRTLFRTVLTGALQDLAQIRDAAGRDLTVSVNLHARNLREDDLLDFVLATASHHGIAPGDIVLELTEESLVSEDAIALQTLLALDGAGIPLSVDDFGTGFSSLSYLSRLPVSEVKLDRSLIAGILGSDRCRAVVESVLQLAARLDLRVVSEGIEEASVPSFLMEHGCAVGQGYLFCPPLPADEWVDHFRAGTAAALV